MGRFVGAFAEWVVSLLTAQNLYPAMRSPWFLGASKS
ncbi:hypothetical protein SAMN05446635_6961 [Burkholderia sp. OK233]|nr:hypothetical protein SAMN05446635_6961 [Burkholderia sp. OK233]